VSMAADTRGRFSAILRENWVEREVSLGRTWEYAGTSNTSSKVSAFPIRRIVKAPKKGFYRFSINVRLTPTFLNQHAGCSLQPTTSYVFCSRRATLISYEINQAAPDLNSHGRRRARHGPMAVDRQRWSQGVQ